MTETLSHAETPKLAEGVGPRSQCVVLVPAFSHIEPVCELALRELETRGYVVRRAFGYAAIDYGRSVMATAALNDGFEQLLWIDADMSFNPDFVDQLRQHQLPIVTGIAVKKGARALACEVLPGTQDIVFGPNGGLLPLRYAGCGFLLTHRSVYEAIQKRFDLPLCNHLPHRRPAFYPFFQPLIVPDGAGHFYLSEDYSFSERAHQCGFEIIADSSQRLYHIGHYAYSWEDAGQGTTRYGSYTFRVVAPQTEGT